VVSHDRYLVERVADTVVALFGDGRITHLPGGVEEYLRRRAADQQAAALPAARQAAAAKAVSGNQVAGKQAAGKQLGGNGEASEAPVATADPTRQRALRKDLQRLERRLESLHRKESDLHNRLAEVGADYATAAELSAALKGLRVEIGNAEDEWMGVAEDLENG
jgi:ATP-binding cassette subfamily F protein uup